MAVQILNDMPDAAVNRGDPGYDLLRELNTRRKSLRVSGRATFMAATIALHVIAIVAFMSARNERVKEDVVPMMASVVDAPQTQVETPPEYVPPPVDVVYALPTENLVFETDAIAADVTPTPVVAQSTPGVAAPPMVESVEYVRPPAPVYPNESKRRRERGTVVLRVLVDVTGRPAQIQVERSSGFTRLDSAARDAVEKSLFRPYEVNGIAQPAQVLIPIEFTRAT